jgi:hypothetical protein
MFREDLQIPFAGRQLDSHPFTHSRVHQRARQRGKPANPIAVHIRFVHTHNSECFLLSAGVADLHGGTETNLIPGRWRRRHDLHGLQDLSERGDAWVRGDVLEQGVQFVLQAL